MAMCLIRYAHFFILFISISFCERNFNFENKFPQFGNVVQVFNASWLNDKTYWTQISKKCHFDKCHSKVVPIERSHAVKKTHCTYKLKKERERELYSIDHLKNGSLNEIENDSSCFDRMQGTCNFTNKPIGWHADPIA